MAAAGLRDQLLNAKPLQPSDAVAALLVLADGRYLMQLRDSRPDIFYPGHWGCFGGAVESDETPLEALRRELIEELEFVVPPPREFTRFTFDFSPHGHGLVTRIYYQIEVPDAALDGLVLHEGAAFAAHGGQELITELRVTPYDAFAIWMHVKWKMTHDPITTREIY